MQRGGQKPKKWEIHFYRSLQRKGLNLNSCKLGPKNTDIFDSVSSVSLLKYRKVYDITSQKSLFFPDRAGLIFGKEWGKKIKWAVFLNIFLR